MANKTYYSQPKHKKGVGAIIAVTACVLALAVGVCAIAVGTSGFKDWAFTKWFPKTEQTAPEVSENGGATITEGESAGMLMVSKAIPLNSYEEYGVAALAENAYSLSVTYTPSNTTYQETTYSMQFADGSDCSAYASLNQTEVGSKTATLSILKPFSKQIIVTASCNRNSDIKARTTVDYVGAWQVDLCQESVGSLGSDIEYICYNTAYGTIEPGLNNAFTLTWHLGEFQTKMNAKGYDLPSNVSYTYNISEVGSSEAICTIEEVILKAGGFSDRNTTEAQAYWTAASSVLLNGQTPEEIGARDIFNYSIVSHRVYNGVTYADYNCQSNNSFTLNNYSGFEVPAQSMTTNTPSIITG